MPTARRISEVVQRWDRIEQCDEWQAPTVVTVPIPSLPVI